MGLMDRVKAQANQLAQMTQDAAQEGRNRIDQAQASRRGDALLRQLGAAVYADRTGRGTPDSQAKIEQLVSEISTHEQQNGLNLTSPQPSWPQPNAPQQNVPQPGQPPENPFGQAGSAYQPAGSSGDAGQVFPPPGGGADAGAGFPPPGTQFFPPPGESDPESGGTSGY
jgi:hypothetical protein